MTVILKVLQRAVARKDFDFLARKLAEQLLEMGWSQEDIAALAARLVARSE